MKSRNSFTLLCLVSLLAVHTSSAAIIAHDLFDYTAGQNMNDVTLNGGSGFIGPWAVTSSTTGTAVTTGDGFTTTPTSGTILAYRDISTITSGTYYLSWRAHNTNNGSRFVGLTLNNGGTEEMTAIQPFGQDEWNLNGVNGLTWIGTKNKVAYPDSDFDSRAGSTFFVLKMELNGASTSDLSLYINPDVHAPEPATPHITAEDVFSGGINRIRFGSGYTNGTETTVIGEFGDLGLTTEWDDIAVIPEPASLLLIGLAGLAWFVLRCRRSSR